MIRIVPTILSLSLLLLCAGCKHPIEAVMRGNVITHMSVLEDRGPVQPMQVVAGDPDSNAKIAIIDVDGLLLNMNMSGLNSVGENPVSIFREKLDQVASDPCYRGVVVRINSPGGGVTASDIMWRDLQAFKQRTRLPVVACIMDQGTGGGYYLATGADHIIAHPTSLLGGMGVILNLYALEDALLQFSIFPATVKAGERTDLGTPLEPLTEENEAILQEIADTYHERYKQIVFESRPGVVADVEEMFDGRIFLPADAIQWNLIDSTGYLDDAVQVARGMAGCPQAKGVMLHRCYDRARSPYAVTPNTPNTGLLPLSVPGFDRSQMPTFLYIWQPEPTFERRASGR